MNASRMVAASILLLAFGCGGGGGGGDGAGTRVTFSPGSFTASFAQGDRVQATTLNVDLSEVPQESVYVVVVQDRPVVGGLDVQQLGTTRFAALVTPACMLEPGVHRGVLRLLLCRDAECTQSLPMTGNELPYEITVTTGKTLTVRMDGVLQPGLWAACSSPGSLTVKTGQRVELTATAPVSWSSSLGFGAGLPTLSDVVETPTSWAATVGNDGACLSGVMLGSLSLRAATSPTPSSNDLHVGFNVTCN
jgi:hypothetical protein